MEMTDGDRQVGFNISLICAQKAPGLRFIE